MQSKLPCVLCQRTTAVCHPSHAISSLVCGSNSFEKLVIHTDRRQCASDHSDSDSDSPLSYLTVKKVDQQSLGAPPSGGLAHVGGKAPPTRRRVLELSQHFVEVYLKGSAAR